MISTYIYSLWLDCRIFLYYICITRPCGTAMYVICNYLFPALMGLIRIQEVIYYYYYLFAPARLLYFFIMTHFCTVVPNLAGACFQLGRYILLLLICSSSTAVYFFIRTHFCAGVPNLAGAFFLFRKVYIIIIYISSSSTVVYFFNMTHFCAVVPNFAGAYFYLGGYMLLFYYHCLATLSIRPDCHLFLSIRTKLFLPLARLPCIFVFTYLLLVPSFTGACFQLGRYILLLLIRSSSTAVYFFILTHFCAVVPNVAGAFFYLGGYILLLLIYFINPARLPFILINTYKLISCFGSTAV